jgi:hypothetical protein
VENIIAAVIVTAVIMAVVIYYRDKANKASAKATLLEAERRIKNAIVEAESKPITSVLNDLNAWLRTQRKG